MFGDAMVTRRAIGRVGPARFCTLCVAKCRDSGLVSHEARSRNMFVLRTYVCAVALHEQGLRVLYRTVPAGQGQNGCGTCGCARICVVVPSNGKRQRPDEQEG